VSALLFLAAAGYLAVDAWRHRGEPVPGREPATGPGDEDAELAVDALDDVPADTTGDTGDDAAAGADAGAEPASAVEEPGVTDDISAPDPASSS
jgi:hypothetical protein